jgi:transcriptional regulator with GAF, ATPase, and Fis domain
LVKVNCASIPKELFESEFFGHARGAFTGAVRDRVGRFQLADRGTLFLDEVGEIPLDLQTKLLRVLQEGDFERVGEDATRHVNVRVIAATNRDLRAEVDAGGFRLDLFYRLSVFPIQVPPLRERRQDLAALATRFIRTASERLHRDVPKVPQREMAKLVAYDWPGNIRELQHVVERAVILSPRGRTELGDSLAVSGADRRAPGARSLEDVERDHIVAVLKSTGWRVSGERGASKILGLKRTTLEARMKRLGIVRPF